MSSYQSRKDFRTPSRRNFLGFGAAGVGVTLLGPWGKSAMAAPALAPTSEPFIVVINLKGGNDGLNTVIPNSLATYFSRRPSIALSDSSGNPTLSLNSGAYATTHYRLHPALVNLAQYYAEGDLAIVHKVGCPQANESHFESETIWARSVRDLSHLSGPLATGWLGRLLGGHLKCGQSWTGQMRPVARSLGRGLGVQHGDVIWQAPFDARAKIFGLGQGDVLFPGVGVLGAAGPCADPSLSGSVSRASAEGLTRCGKLRPPRAM